MKKWWETINSNTVDNLHYPLNKQLTSGNFSVGDSTDIKVTSKFVVPFFPDLAGVWAIDTRAGRFMFWQLERFMDSGFDMNSIYPDISANYKTVSYGGKTSMDKYVTWYDGNVACLNVTGVLMRDEPPSAMYSASSITYRQLTDVINELSVTDAAQKIVLKISSMGGNTLGAFPCADSIAEANKVKPITAFVDDNCCSAAYLLASQCKEIVSAQAAMVGSIGTVTVLVDDSAAAEKMGIKRVVVSSSEIKGMGMDGKVTQPLIDNVKDKIMQNHEFLRSRIMEGRGMNESELNAVSTGDVYYPEDALRLKLIDRVANFHDMFDISTESDKPTSNRRSNKTGGSNEMSDQEMQALQESNAKLEKELEVARQEAAESKAAADAALAQQQGDEPTVTKESVAEMVTQSTAESVKPIEAQLEAERKRNENLETQIEEINKSRAKEEKAFRMKMCSNWVDKKVAEGNILPRDCNSIKALLSSLADNTDQMEIEYIDNDGETKKVSGQHYEVAMQILSSALTSKVNFSEMSQAQGTLSTDQKAEIESDWFSKQLAADGEPLDEDQALVKSTAGDQFSISVGSGGSHVGIEDLSKQPGAVMP